MYTTRNYYIFNFYSDKNRECNKYKFILFDSIQNVENYDKGVPGEPLSIALSALVGWSVTLRRLIKVISKK